MGEQAGYWDRTRHPGIYKHQGAEGVRYRATWRNPKGQSRSETFKTVQAAIDARAERNVSKRRGTYIDPDLGKITVRDFAENIWLRDALNLRQKSRDLYGDILRLHVYPAIGDERLMDVDKESVKALLADMKRGGKGTATINLTQRVIHRLFAVAVENGRLGLNPATGVHVERVEPHKPQPLEPEQITKIANTVPVRYRPLVYLLAYGGLRIGEAAALTVGDFDYHSRTVHVRASSSEINGVTGTKTGKSRTVDVPEPLAKMLQAHVENPDYCNRFDRASLIFTNERGGPLRQNSFRRNVFQPACKKAGITPRPRVHDLRHTSASLMARAGYSMVEAGRQLGHSAVLMTDRYSHLFPSERQVKADALGKLLEA